MKQKLRKLPICLSLILSLSYSQFAYVEEELQLIALPVRLHIAQSDIAGINADISAAQLQSLFKDVNAIWEQAGIIWLVEGVEYLSASAESQYRRASERSSGMSTSERMGVMQEVCDYEEPLEGRWNLCIVNRFPTGAGGVYFTGGNRNIPSLVWSIQNSQTRYNSATLAHELGHSLGLPHASNIQDNLMTGGGNNMRREGRINDIKLTAEEIEIARANAAKGSPVKRLPAQ